MNNKTEQLSCRRLFVLDIDENIASIQIDENDAHNLSKSAQISLSLSTEGTLNNPELIPGMHAQKVTAFRRQEWKLFFENIVSINERYKKQTNDDIPLISIIFITNASYTGKEFINNVFKPFFGDQLTDHLVPDVGRFYNRSNQLEENHRLDKSDYMEYLYPELQIKFGLSDRSQITLIDDSQLNIYGAKKYGFSAIHHPSNPSQRPHFLTFTTHGTHIFARMYQMITEANEFVRSLDSQTELHF